MSAVTAQDAGMVTIQVPPWTIVGTMSPGARSGWTWSGRAFHSSRSAPMPSSTATSFSIALTAPPSRQSGCGISA